VDLSEALRAGDYRVTRPRQIVWDILTTAEGHLDVQEIADRVREVDESINVSSVYRTLSLFAQLDLVRESHLRTDIAATWEMSHEDAVVHLVCDECSIVVHHDSQLISELQAQIFADADFIADTIDVKVTGRCELCQQKAGADR
jgi:Fur family ferric uptake transcriptional regulator